MSIIINAKVWRVILIHPSVTVSICSVSSTSNSIDTCTHAQLFIHTPTHPTTHTHDQTHIRTLIYALGYNSPTYSRSFCHTPPPLHLLPTQPLPLSTSPFVDEANGSLRSYNTRCTSEGLTTTRRAEKPGDTNQVVDEWVRSILSSVS